MQMLIHGISREHVRDGLGALWRDRVSALGSHHEHQARTALSTASSSCTASTSTRSSRPSLCPSGGRVPAGEAAVRLDAGYAIDRDRRVIVVDSDTETGRAVTRVFTGFCIHEFGDDAFPASAIPSTEPAILASQLPPKCP